MRKIVLVLALLALGPGALAQRAVSFRLSLPPAGLGLGLEAPLERNLAFRGFVDMNPLPSGPSFLAAGELLFKPDLGQLDRDLRGIRPYFGGGLAGRFAGPGELGLHLSLGVEFLLDARTGIFLDGEYFYAFGGGRLARTVIGANLR